MHQQMTTTERLSRIPLLALNLAMALLLTVSAAAQADCTWKRGKEGKWSKCQQITTVGLVMDMGDTSIVRDTTHTRWMRMRVVQLKCVRDDGTVRKLDKSPVAIDYKPCPAPSR